MKTRSQEYTTPCLHASNKRMKLANNPSIESDSNSDECLFARIPDDIIENVIVDKLGVTDLCNLAMVSPKFNTICGNEALWRDLFLSKWPNPSLLTLKAASMCGSWKRLYASKLVTDKLAAPWQKPCEYEMKAALEQLTRTKAKDASKDMSVLFLLDGSGSVHEEDFSTMVNFVLKTTQEILVNAADSKIGVIQFSNDVRVEIEPALVDLSALEVSLKAMARMNGGTNIAAAIRKAGQVLKASSSPDAVNLVVLVTDGRVDSYQARDARDMAARLADEQRGVELFAFAVGRGVDRAELEGIVRAGSGSCEEDAEAGVQRCIDLCVRDDAPW